MVRPANGGGDAPIRARRYPETYGKHRGGRDAPDDGGERFETMQYGHAGQPEHWMLLGIFFLIFALYGFLKKPRSATQCLSCITVGLLALAVNAVALLVANRIGYGSYDIGQLLSLQRAAVESSLIIIGYCMIIRGLAMFVRGLFYPAVMKADRRYL
jgi:uncharacterized protein (DUF486 family)